MLPPPEASRSSRLETGRCAPVPEAVTAAAGYPFRVPREPLIEALGGCPADHEELSPTRLRFAQRATKLGQFPLPADEETAGRGSSTSRVAGHDSHTTQWVQAGLRLVRRRSRSTPPTPWSGRRPTRTAPSFLAISARKRGASSAVLHPKLRRSVLSRRPEASRRHGLG